MDFIDNTIKDYSQVMTQYVTIGEMSRLVMYLDVRRHEDRPIVDDNDGHCDDHRRIW